MSQTEDDDQAIDNAWKIHAALADWTGKVDTKASFALTIETALLAGVVTLSSSGRIFASISGWFAIALYVLGVVLLVASALFAVWVVRPRLRSPNLESEAADSYVYFGHLRLQSKTEVLKHLQETPILPVLANQLVQMSKIAWQKHRFVQISMTVGVLGVLFLGISAGALTAHH
ncbi:Uncharacterised protein [Mycobacteroides abscessus subsp. abscessus]|nr:Uncharacterised protein [Mycobacteroides abscessus subsp. abscessus]